MLRKLLALLCVASVASADVTYDKTTIPPRIPAYTTINNPTNATAAPTTVADYLVKCTNGSTGATDYTLISNAVTAAGAAGGGVVRLSSACKVNAQITIPSNVILDGQFQPFTVAAAANWAASTIKAPLHCADAGHDITVTRFNADLTSSALASIKLLSCQGDTLSTTYSRIHFTDNYVLTPGDGVAFNAVSDSTVTGNYIANCAGACIDYWSTGDNATITDNTVVVTVGAGIGIIYTAFNTDNTTKVKKQYANISHNHVELQAASGIGEGIYLQNLGTCSLGSVGAGYDIVADNTIHLADGKAGIAIWSDFCNYNSRISGNIINADGVTVQTHPAIEVSGASSGIQIEGNLAYGWMAPTVGSDSGVFANKGENGSIINNKCFSCSALLVGATSVKATTIIYGNDSGTGTITVTNPMSLAAQLTSTVATGTAPLVVASTTNVANLNASSLSGATFAAPGAIGSGTASTGAFTTVTGSNATFTGDVYAGVAQEIGWTGRGIFTSPAANQFRFGPADSATPSGQIIFTQGARGGTDTNVGGGNLTIQSGAGTGTGTASSLTLKTPQIGSTGTTLQSQVIGISITPTQIQIGNGTSNPDFFFGGSGTVSGTPITSLFAAPPAIGGTTPAAGAFTTLSASSTVSGAGFSTYLASPPAIGGSAPAAGAFTTLTSSSGMPLTSLATQATNTVTGNATSGAAVPTALAVGTCSTAGSALKWTTNTGFGCNTAIDAATLGSAAANTYAPLASPTFTGTPAAPTAATATNTTQLATTAFVTGASPRVIFQSGIPIGIPSSGTMGANGAVTLTTAMSVIYARIFLYFPAGKLASGSAAGFYPCVMSSTTVGQCYNVSTPLAGGALAWPALVAVVDSGPGAYTQDTTIQTAFTVTIPANVIGPNGSLTFEYMGSHNNSAGTKTPTVLWGASTVLTGALTTTLGVNMMRVFYNRSVTNAQVALTTGTGNSFGTLSVANAQYAIDTTSSSTFTFKLTLAVATDQIICEAVRLVALYGA